MSFGYGIGDILALTKLAWDAVQNTKKACGEYDELTQQVASFHAVLIQIENEAKKAGSILATPERKAELEIVLLPCRTALFTLNEILQKFNALSASDERREGLAKFCQSVRFGNGEMQDLATLRGKMTACVSVVSLYQSTLFFGRMEKDHDELKFIMLAVRGDIARQQAVEGNSREGSILTTYGDDDKAIWKEFRRSLIKQGFNSQLLEKNKNTIIGLVMNDGAFETASAITLTSNDSSTAVGSEMSDLPGNAEKLQRRKRTDGYRQCSSSVVGKWSNGTHRVFRASELRFEVIFETPVLFTAPPTNKKGPIASKPIYYIDGTSESYASTWTPEPGSEREPSRFSRAYDGRATWVGLLSTLQRLESESRGSDNEMLKCSTRKTEIPEPDYTLSVGMQRLTRSWDSMPPNIKQPFATTTMSHLVELAAMLGLCWKSFDQKTWLTRAEGNGLMLTSTLVNGLVMFTFYVTGAQGFKENRLIPCQHIKELCFGSVPSIFTVNTQPKFALAFGSRKEVIDTLKLLGCTNEAITKYEQRHSHMFSLAFEIIGMLADPLRIRGSSFKLLPNPTTDYYTPNINLGRLIVQFRNKLSDFITTINDGISNGTRFKRLLAIADQWRSVHSGDLDANYVSIDLREAVHDVLDDSTDFLGSKSLDSVLDVIAAHLTAVLEYLDSSSTDHTAGLRDLSGRHGSEDNFLDIYFGEILPAVISTGPWALKRRYGDILHRSEGTRRDKLEEEATERTEIWFTLIWRMLCWLLLHDFDKADVNILPSDLKGSRMPVYIA